MSAKQQQIFEGDMFRHYLDLYLCPLCKKRVTRSNFLMDIFAGKPLTEYVANLVTHYRHHHITSWNKCWNSGGSRYRSGWFGDYEAEKSNVNERAKRQLIRKCYPIFVALNITPEHFEELKGTAPETMAMANKFLRT